VWSELSNMLGGKDVDHAFLNILNFNLYSAIVKLPPTASMYHHSLPMPARLPGWMAHDVVCSSGLGPVRS